MLNFTALKLNRFKQLPPYAMRFSAKGEKNTVRARNKRNERRYWLVPLGLLARNRILRLFSTVGSPCSRWWTMSQHVFSSTMCEPPRIELRLRPPTCFHVFRNRLKSLGIECPRVCFVIICCFSRSYPLVCEPRPEGYSLLRKHVAFALSSRVKR